MMHAQTFIRFAVSAKEKKMKKIIFITLTAVFLISMKMTPADAQESYSRPLIQIALLLDTSNSMDGLINQAKSQLWKDIST